MKKIIIFVLSILLVTTTLVLIPLNYYKLTNDEKIEKYLDRYKRNISSDKDSDSSWIQIMDTDIRKSQLVFTGEAHIFSANYKLELEFLKQLHEKYYFNYFLTEMPFSTGERFNLYLRTGDENILSSIRNMFKGGLCDNDDYFNFWKELYRYNKNLPVSKKIKVVGIDDEVPGTAIPYLITLIPDYNAPDVIAPIIHQLESSKKYKSIDDLIAFITELCNSLDNYPKQYKKYLGENYLSFKITCQVFKCTLIHQKLEKEDGDPDIRVNDREDAMYDSFKIIYNEIPKGKYYGEFGAEHICLSHDIAAVVDKPIAMRLNSYADSPLKNKVLSICYLYTGNNLPQVAYELMYPIGITDINKTTAADYTLLKLNGRGAPFQLINRNLHLNKSIVTDYFQYIVVVKNSPLCAGLELDGSINNFLNSPFSGE